MRPSLPLSAAVLMLLTPLPPARGTANSAPPVTLLSLPDGGIQPQAVVGGDDVLHVLYFSGNPAGGDLYYVHERRTEGTFSDAIRVNSLAGSALATGSVRGGQIALGRGGRIHVAWHGARDIGIAGTTHMPVWYARLTADGRSFAPQVDVAGTSRGIDGTTIAADRSGHVYVAWHGLGAADGEDNRTLYIARSRDDGGHFGSEAAAPRVSGRGCGLS